MKKALRKRDMTVTEDPRQAGFVIEGRVEISAPTAEMNRPFLLFSIPAAIGNPVYSGMVG